MAKKEGISAIQFPKHTQKCKMSLNKNKFYKECMRYNDTGKDGRLQWQADPLPDGYSRLISKLAEDLRGFFSLGYFSKTAHNHCYVSLFEKQHGGKMTA